MRRSLHSFVLAALTVALVGGGITYARVAAQAAGPQAIFTTAAGEVRLNLEVADTPDKQMRGLMGRESMAEDTGMLFVFPDTVQVGFWMKDTLLPLSIAFISADGKIVDVLDMDPQTTNVHTPSSAYRYAIEVNQGYYARHGVAIGDTVQFVLGSS